MSGLKKTAMVLAAIGALNWGLAELGWNLVSALIGSWAPVLESIIYYLVGLSGLWMLVDMFKS